MHHPWARSASARLVAVPALGAAEAAHLAVIALYGDQRLPAAVVHVLQERALALPPTVGQAVSDVRNQQPLPEDGPEVLAQWLPWVADFPDAHGLGITLALLVADVWPHLAHEERAQVRAAFLAGLVARHDAARDLTRAQLRLWNRRLCTLELSTSPGLERLIGLQDAPSAEAAYARLSAHLHRPGRQLAVLLGSLAATAVDHEAPTSERLGLLAASAHLAPITEQLPADLVAVLLAQVAHGVWLARSTSEGDHAGIRHLEDAVLSGDGPAAGRAARAMAGDSEQFWAVIAPLLPQAATATSLLTIAAVARRSAGHRAVAPEDAAALARAVAACIAPS